MAHDDQASALVQNILDGRKCGAYPFVIRHHPFIQRYVEINAHKNAFSFYRRSDGKSLRVVARPSILGDGVKALAELHRQMNSGSLTQEERKRWHTIREEITARLMHGRLQDLFEIKPVQADPPAKARILSSLTCDSCGEAVMESRIRAHRDRRLCAPCFQALPPSQEERSLEA